MTESMKSYLQATEFCDCTHDSIQVLVKKIADRYPTQREKAVALFYYVRDEIKSGMDRFDVKASETLVKGFGGCVGKNNLLIALLRAAGIPGRYGFIKMHKQVFSILDKFGLSHLAFSQIPEYLPHVICSACLGERWIFADCSFDRDMYTMFYAEKYNWSIDWDGSEDLLVAREFHAGEFEFFSSMDTLLAENFNCLPPLILARPMFSIANVYNRVLRSQHRQRKLKTDRMSE